MLLRGIVIKGWIFPGAIDIWLKEIWKHGIINGIPKTHLLRLFPVLTCCGYWAQPQIHLCQI